MQKVKGVVLGGKLQNRKSGYQGIRVQVIRKAGYQVKEQKADDKQEGNIEFSTGEPSVSNKEYRIIKGGFWPERIFDGDIDNQGTAEQTGERFTLTVIAILVIVWAVLAG